METIYEVSVFLWAILIGIVMPVMILSMILSIVGANAARVLMRKGQKDRYFVNRLFLTVIAIVAAISMTHLAWSVF